MSRRRAAVAILLAVCLVLVASTGEDRPAVGAIGRN
jgi:hypothetical protein